MARPTPLLSKRRAARFAAMQALYQVELTGAPVEAVIAEFGGHRLAQLLEPLGGDHASPAVDRAWFETVARGAWAAREQLDPEIGSCLVPGWTLARCGYLLRACLRAGAFELALRSDVPVKVVITEYVELAHAFLGEGDAGFVNAVLDRLAPRLRQPQAAL
jgi:N utilization substance protein B